MREKYDVNRYLRVRRKRTILATLIIFVLIPLTIFVGIKYLGDRKYLIISLLIITYTMIPFFLVFEKRKPKAREVVIIAMMSALTTCGILACYMMIPFQAGTALVIISGISFGPEAGFLVGSLARFCCNFFQGQGPWTPWQMFSWGIMGFIAGLIFNKVDIDKLKSRSFQIVRGPVITILISVLIAYCIHVKCGEGVFLGWQLYGFGALGLIFGLIIQRKRLPIDDITLSIYGFLTTFIIYGGIMNIATMVMASAIPNTGISMSFQSLAVLYISGVPYDGVHALGTAFFMFLFGEKIIQKLERIKIKYGIYK